MTLSSGFSMTLSNPIGICLVLLGLVVMPVAVLVLPFIMNTLARSGGREIVLTATMQT
jgi:hypothetical protein